MVGKKPAHTDGKDDEGGVSLAQRLVLKKGNNLLVEHQHVGENLISDGVRFGPGRPLKICSLIKRARPHALTLILIRCHAGSRGEGLHYQDAALQQRIDKRGRVPQPSARASSKIATNAAARGPLLARYYTLSHVRRAFHVLISH
jgi:hypothetical protein